MNKYLYKNIIKNFFLDLFFPKFCFGCGRENTYLCNDCKSLLEIAEYDYCLCETNPTRLLSPTQVGKCQRCQDRKLSGLYFALSYKEKSLTRKLIHNFKYKPYVKDLAETLANLLIEHFILTKKNTNDVWESSILLPIPLDNKKLKSRGYNQSEKLCKELSKILKIPVISNCLIKIKETRPQMTLNKTEREKNLKNAFTLKNAKALKNKKVFLVDDVYTTGSTMQECARILKASGIKQVWGICIAREG